MKKTDIVRRAVAIGAFVAIIGLFLFIAGFLLSPRNAVAHGFYSEPPNTVDVLFVGSSHIMAAVSPTQIWKEHRYTSYVISSWSQPPWTSYYYVKEALKRQKPKAVVVDGYAYTYGDFSFLPENADSVSDEFSLQMPPSLNRVALAAAMRMHQKNPQKLYNYLPIIRYHSRWKYATPDDLLYPFKEHPTTNKGYGPVYEHKAVEQLAMPPKVMQAPMHPGAQKYLNKLISLCEKENIKLIVMTTPYQQMPGEYRLYESVKNICRKNNVEYINYNEPKTLMKTGFDYSLDMAENEHVNFRGSRKITANLGKWLFENCNLSSTVYSDATVQSWDNAARVEERDYENMDLRIGGDIVRYAEKLAKGKGYIVCIATKGELATAGKEKAQKFFDILGLDKAVFSKNGMQTAAILKDGKPVKISRGDAVEYKSGGLTFTAMASMENALITVNGKDESRNRQGINLVVYDEESGKVIHSVSFNAYDGYAMMTK